MSNDLLSAIDPILVTVMGSRLSRDDGATHNCGNDGGGGAGDGTSL